MILGAGARFHGLTGGGRRRALSAGALSPLPGQSEVGFSIAPKLEGLLVL